MVTLKAEDHLSFITFTVLEQCPRSHLKCTACTTELATTVSSSMLLPALSKLVSAKMRMHTCQCTSATSWIGKTTAILFAFVARM